MNTTESPVEILKISNSLLANDVEKTAYYCHNDVELLAIVLSNSDLVLWKVNDRRSNHFLKWIPWKDDPNAKIQAVSFQPPSSDTVLENKIQLVIITLEGVIHVLRIDRILNGDNVNNNVSTYFLFSSCPFRKFDPTAVVWWNCSHLLHRDVAIIGGRNGQIVFFSLSCSSYITSLNTSSPTSIFSLSLCVNLFGDYSYLLITNDLRQQWKLLLEKEMNGSTVVTINFRSGNEIARFERNNELISKMQKSKLQEFKQLSFETFVLLKQKLNDSRKSIQEKPHITTTPTTEYSELQECDCDGSSFVTVQQFKKRKILAGLFEQTAVLLLYVQNKESVSLVHHKLNSCSLVTSVLLTNAFIYVADIVEGQESSRILVYSTRLSEAKKAGDSKEFNPASFVQSFLFAPNEQIICLFKTKITLPQQLNIVESLPSDQNRTKIKQFQQEDEWSDACLVVTNKGVYTIGLRANPVALSLESITQNSYFLVKKLPFIFNLQLPKLIEVVSEKLIEEGRVMKAIRLCSTFRWYSGKFILKLASEGYVQELIKHGEWFLKEAEFDLPAGEKIHLANFIVSCYAERYLHEPENGEVRQEFLKFLLDNYDYDEEMNLYLLGKYRQCDIVHFLCVTRGLYVDTAAVLANMIEQNDNDELKTLHKFDGFWELFSEASLVESFVLSKKAVHLHTRFFREHVNDVPEDILSKLSQLYDPTQAALKPVMCRMLRTSRDEYLELDDANMIDWVTNYLFVNVRLIEDRNYDNALIAYILRNLDPLSSPIEESPIKQTEFHNSQSAPILSAGYAHAALIKNGSLVTWGQSINGRLGTGPTLSQTSTPVLNTWFDNYRVRVKQVSCGKNHTLALTENGVYSWGSSKFGQLGIGTAKQSLHPRLINALSDRIVVGVDAGQYHSLAVDISGGLYTWGWNVHGQLGHGDIFDRNCPTLVQQLRNTFISAACGGQAHSLLLTKEGDIYTVGCNTFGQLGTGSTAKSTTPVKVFGIQESIIMIDTGYFHNLALSDSNRLYTWGNSPQVLKLQSQMQKRTRTTSNANEKGEANGPQRVERRGSDSYVDGRSNAQPYAEVIESTSNASHDFATVPTDSNKHLSPTLVDTNHVEGNIMQISCGLYHSSLLTTDSKIYTWGRNTDGQLGNSEKLTDTTLPTLVDVFAIKISSTDKEQAEMMNRPMWRVSCGKDYTLAVELEGRIFGWGNNSMGQLGVPPQEDASVKRLLNEKFVGHKNAKRLIKVSHGGVNVVDKPVEMLNLPKMQYSFVQDGSSPDRYSRLECNADVPELRVAHHVIRNGRQLVEAGVTSENRRFHYFLECFHRYYDGDFILRACVEKENFLAAAKIYRLNYQFYEAFFYATKALLTHAKRTSLEEGEDGPKSSAVENAATSDRTSLELTDDIVTEAVSILDGYYKLTANFTPNKIGQFLKKIIASWIGWNLPMKSLEEFLSLHLATAAYPLAVFLFGGDNKTSFNDGKMDDHDRISEEAWNERNIYLYKSPNDQPTADESRTDDADERKYELDVEEIRRILSTAFLLKLTGCVAATMPEKSPSNFVEFVRLFRNIIYAPSILKKDDREADEILLSTLNNVLCANSSSVVPNKFIQIPYEDLQGKTIEDRLIAFSCGHFTISQAEFDRDLENVLIRLNALRLFNTSETIRRWYAESNVFDTCCPKCLYQYLENEMNASNDEGENT